MPRVVVSVARTDWCEGTPGTRKYLVTPQHTKPSPLTPRAGTEALSAPRGRTTPPRRRSNALSRWTESTNLMRETIRGHQAQSGVTHSRGGTEGVTNLVGTRHQRPSGAIRSNEPGEGEAIEVIRRNQE